MPGSGCANGVFASGAPLTGSGEASVVGDTLVLACTGQEPSNSGLYFQADNDLSPGIVWGDGLRCAGGNLKRLGVRFADGAGASDTSAWTTPVSIKAGNVSAGDTKYYQVWYRNPLNSQCGSDFNASNGYAVTWTAGGGSYDGMVSIPAGTFVMGDHHGVGDPNELPLHSVTLDAFDIGIYEVTNQEYADYLNTAHAQARVTVLSGQVFSVGAGGKHVCDTTAYTGYSEITWNGSTFGVMAGKENHPMTMVTWYGACTYANQKSRDHGLAHCYDEMTWDCDFNAEGFRLPTEAEWEYAARGGEHNPYYRYPWGDSVDGSHANYWGSGDPYEGPAPETTPIGYYDGNQTPAGADMANGYGLYDTSGNLWEWCWDTFDPNYYSYSPPFNPTGPDTPGSPRVFRGGSWFSDPSELRSACRSADLPVYRDWYVGFRVLAVRP